jgi:hypothetical protein
VSLPGNFIRVTGAASARAALNCPRQNAMPKNGRPRWQALLLVAEHNGPPMFARIGVMRALNRHVERVFDPSRTDKHWGRRG